MKNKVKRDEKQKFEFLKVFVKRAVSNVIIGSTSTSVTCSVTGIGKSVGPTTIITGCGLSTNFKTIKTLLSKEEEQSLQKICFSKSTTEKFRNSSFKE